MVEVTEETYKELVEAKVKIETVERLLKAELEEDSYVNSFEKNLAAVIGLEVKE